MAFKLGSETRGFRDPLKNPMDFGTTVSSEDNIAQANMDGTMTVNPNVDLNSPFGKTVIKHEAKHLEQIESGRGGFNDGWVMWEGEKHERKDGKIFYNSKLYSEGDKNLPWEKEAVEAEKNN